MIKVGEHITLDIIGTDPEYAPPIYARPTHPTPTPAHLTILNISKYKFEPQGFTILALLAESHISFHTFPEKGIISFDFFTCGKISPSIAIDIIKSLKDRKACLMSNHGQVAFGENLSKAFELAQEVENICHQYIIALKMGEPKILSFAEMKKILDKVKNYKSG